ncbi:MAG: arginine--tRNA ligase [Patescibacteria group bacterium]|nr:MAG: arginine--tRNA ligase [Patescibacteria group bacterium]
MISQIAALLKNALEKMQISDIQVSVTPTEDPSFGDYATNVAFVIAKKLKKSPLEAASLLVDELQEEKSEMIERIDIAKPGFINFTLKNTFLCSQLIEPVSEEKSKKFNGKKIMIEFTDPNPFKEFHIGHLYSNIVGEALARLIESQGAEVRRVNYQGDVGLHVAKAIYGLIIKLKEENIDLNDIDKRTLKEKAKFLGEAYALGAKSYEEDEAAKKEIIELNKKIYTIVEAPESEKYPDIKQLYYKGRSWSLEYFETIYKRLGTKFWKYYFESQASPVGLALVKEYLKKGVFEESENAIIFKGEKYGLHNRVFINSLGLPTYEAKELGLAISKYHDFPYDLSIIVTGNEINEYFRVLLQVLSLIKPYLAEKTLHIGHGMVRLPEGKMSSRMGNIITGEWLLDEAVARAKAKLDEVKKQIRGETSHYKVASWEQDQIAEIVGVGAVKYALLRSSIGKDIEFRFEESISFEGNSGPYLQYTYVRTRSVLEKSGLTEKKVFLNKVECLHSLSKDERQLLIDLIRWSDVKKEAAEKYSPSDICTYLFELAQHFNLFYQKYPILTASENIREFRLLLTQRVGETIKEGLWLLGIQSPEKM